MEECYFIACNFTKSNTPCVFQVFKIVQMVPNRATHTAQKMKFSIKDFFSKCDKIWIWSHLLKKSLMENFIFCGVASHIFPIREIIELRNPILRSKLFFISCTQNFPVKKQKLSIQKSPALIKIDY